ncbi:MAG: hypothetical protein AAF755_07225 [Pseudomonadota bacterium]
MRRLVAHPRELSGVYANASGALIFLSSAGANVLDGELALALMFLVVTLFSAFHACKECYQRHRQ